MGYVATDASFTFSPFSHSLFLYLYISSSIPLSVYLSILWSLLSKILSYNTSKSDSTMIGWTEWCREGEKSGLKFEEKRREKRSIKRSSHVSFYCFVKKIHRYFSLPFFLRVFLPSILRVYSVRWVFELLPHTHTHTLSSQDYFLFKAGKLQDSRIFIYTGVYRVMLFSCCCCGYYIYYCCCCCPFFKKRKSLYFRSFNVSKQIPNLFRKIRARLLAFGHFLQSTLCVWNSVCNIVNRLAFSLDYYYCYFESLFSIYCSYIHITAYNNDRFFFHSSSLINSSFFVLPTIFTLSIVISSSLCPISTAENILYLFSLK